MSLFSSRSREKEQELYDLYFDHVYKTCYFMVKNHDDAEDLTQEAFMKLFNKLHTLRDEQKIRAWITTLSTRLALDFLRKQKKAPIDSLDEGRPLTGDSSADIPAFFEAEAFSALLVKVKPEFREILLLKYGEHQSEQEIARLLGIQVGTVKSRLSRAKAAVYSYSLGGEDA